MSTLNSQTDWKNIQKETLDSKYEKCKNITEEIYKRINITFQVKKLETSTQSDISEGSDQIDSNDLSNETDLFACDKSSLSSSTEVEKLALGSAACEKYININNNEETKVKKTAVVCRKPKKRFRKRIKKQLKQAKDLDGSSDEDPLYEADRHTSPHRPVTVPNIVIVTSDLSYKIKSPPPTKHRQETKRPETTDSQSIETSLSVNDRREYERDRGSRTHMKFSHLNSTEKTLEQRKLQ